MKKLSKKEKTLLSLIGKTTMGMISTTNSEVTMTAWKLSLKNLVKRHQTNLPFCGGIDYYSLTGKGWDVAKELQ